ncbi:MAG TPA: TetR/AcrR family transcriptional regulator [Jatrophihabitans sp.]
MVEVIERVTDGRRARWAEHRAERRAEFVAAGATAVDRYGADVSAEQVAEVALISRTVLYRYFRDRDDLRLAIAEHIVADLASVTERAVKAREPRTSRQMIEGPVRQIVDWFDAYPHRHYFIRTQRSLANPDEAKNSFASSVTQTLRVSLAILGIPEGEALPTAHAIVGVIEYLAAWWLDDRTLSRDGITSVISDSIWHLIDGNLRGQGIVLDYDGPTPAPAIPL